MPASRYEAENEVARSKGKSAPATLLKVGFALASMALGALGVQRPVLALALVGGLGLILVGFAWPQKLILWSIPFILLPDIPTLPYSPKVLLVVALGCVWVGGAVRGSWRLGWTHLLLAAFTLLLAVSYFSNGAPGAERHFASFLAAVVLCVVLSSVGPGLGQTVKTIGFSGVLFAGLALALNFGAQDRLEGFGLNPNFLGHALALGCIALVALYLPSASVLFLVPAAGAALAVAATGSRGAVVALAAGVCYLLIGHGKRVLAVVLALVLVVAGFLVPPISSRVENSALFNRSSTSIASNNKVRFEAALVAVRYSIQNPIFGIGYGQFTEMTPGESALRIRINTHNDYLRLAAEAGLLTLCVFIGLLVMALNFHSVTRGPRRPIDWEIRSTRAVLVVGLVGICFANSLANLQVTGAFWISLGSLLRVREEVRQSDDSSGDVLEATQLGR
jgi:O-antigen ligase